MEARRHRRLLQRNLLSGTPEASSGEFESWNRNQEASPLLRLPPEIRNRIYELVLTVGIISVHHKPSSNKWRTNNSRPQGHGEIVAGGFYCRRFDIGQNPWVDTRNSVTKVEERGMTLLAPVCRQLYRETSLLPFQLNAWCFESVPVMERYIVRERRLPREQRRALRTLYINTSSTKAIHKCFSKLEVLVWYNRWSGLRKTLVGGKQALTREQPIRSRPGGQAMQFFDT